MGTAALPLGGNTLRADRRFLLWLVAAVLLVIGVVSIVAPETANNDPRPSTSTHIGRRRSLSVPSSVVSSALRFASVGISGDSPPMSAPPTKLCFDQSHDQVRH